MQNKKHVVILIGTLLFIAGETSAQGFDKVSLFGGTLNYNVRKGTLDFGDNNLEDLVKPSMVTGGFVLGKRWRILPGLRLQISANIKYGAVVDDTLPGRYFTSGGAAYFTETVIKTTFLYGGGVVDFQVPLASAPGSTWYMHAGGGGHVVDMNESEMTLDNPPNIVQPNYYTVSQLALSASIHGGLGFEIILSPRYGFAVDYSLHYWYPVHYGMTRDLFPSDPVHYHERFLSHGLDLLLLVKRR